MIFLSSTKWRHYNDELIISNLIGQKFLNDWRVRAINYQIMKRNSLKEYRIFKSFKILRRCLFILFQPVNSSFSMNFIVDHHRPFSGQWIGTFIQPLYLMQFLEHSFLSWFLVNFTLHSTTWCKTAIPFFKWHSNTFFCVRPLNITLLSALMSVNGFNIS